MAEPTLPCGHPPGCLRKEPSHWGGDGPSGFTWVCGWCADVAEAESRLKECRALGEIISNLCYNFGHGGIGDERDRETARQLSLAWDTLVERRSAPAQKGG